ncbi:uncharacterized protein LOC141584817 isoform X3 [Saimiri boliviensis]
MRMRPVEAALRACRRRLPGRARGCPAAEGLYCSARARCGARLCGRSGRRLAEPQRSAVLPASPPWPGHESLRSQKQQLSLTQAVYRKAAVYCWMTPWWLWTPKSASKSSTRTSGLVGYPREQ